MTNIKLTFGQMAPDKAGALNFPPENAKSKTVKGSQMIDIALVDRQQEITR